MNIKYLYFSIYSQPNRKSNGELKPSNTEDDSRYFAPLAPTFESQARYKRKISNTSVSTPTTENDLSDALETIRDVLQTKVSSNVRKLHDRIRQLEEELATSRRIIEQLTKSTPANES